MSDSSSSNHFSTWPLAFDVEMVSLKRTTSPSLLFMWVISKVSVNSRLLIPSKHFFKWGCTLEIKGEDIIPLAFLNIQGKAVKTFKKVKNEQCLQHGSKVKIKVSNICKINFPKLITSINCWHKEWNSRWLFCAYKYFLLSQW